MYKSIFLFQRHRVRTLIVASADNRHRQPFHNFQDTNNSVDLARSFLFLKAYMSKVNQPKLFRWHFLRKLELGTWTIQSKFCEQQIRSPDCHGNEVIFVKRCILNAQELWLGTQMSAQHYNIFVEGCQFVLECTKP